MKTLRALKVALAATICIFAMAAVYTSVNIVKRQHALREVSRYNVVWASSQALAEFHRLEHRVAAFGLPDSVYDKDEVLKRFDVMFNRLNILRSGDVGALVQQFPELKAVIDDLDATLNALDPIVQSIEKPGNVRTILARLAPLETKLIRFAASANQFGGGQVAADQQQLLTLHWVFSFTAGGLFVCGVAFIGLLFFQNQLIHRAHAEQRALARDLSRAKDEAVAGSLAKSRFLATMSHELRTPLNAIIGFGEIIATETFGPIGQPKYRAYAADILKSGRHMLDLVNDILTMAKLDAGHYELNLAPLELYAIAQSTLDIFRGTEIANGRDIAINEDSDRPAIHADERAVRQMLLNLLSNAVKFSAPDAPVHIDLRRGANGDVTLSVVDQGIGMSAAEAELAVQPFHQVDNRMARRYEGTGLGLSIVKALIEDHGGKLRIDSTVGKGSRISLVFPPSPVLQTELANAA